MEISLRKVRIKENILNFIKIISKQKQKQKHHTSEKLDNPATVLLRIFHVILKLCANINLHAQV